MIQARSVVATIALLMVLGGCARTYTNLTTFVDPSRRGQPPYTSVVVAAYQATLKDKKIIETVVVELLTASGVKAVRSIDVAAPTENLDFDQWSERIIDTRMDIVLFIDPVGSDIGEDYVPPSYTPPSYYSRGSFSGGRIDKYPVAIYDLAVIELESGKTVWKAEADSRGRPGASFSELSRDVAQKAVQRLTEQGFF